MEVLVGNVRDRKMGNKHLPGAPLRIPWQHIRRERKTEERQFEAEPPAAWITSFAVMAGATVPATSAATMIEAVEIAAAAAVPGDTVLLAPGFASFDMFESYGARGDAFAEAVRALREAS